MQNGKSIQLKLLCPAAPECGGIEDAYGAEACLGAYKGVEKPDWVGKVGTYAWVWGTEEVDEN
jgi:hypothetical protein